MNKPLVSIIIPVYNGANYLCEAIDSALAQTYENIELLVVNDGSNDNGATKAIAMSYGNNIRYFEKDNGGVSSALNLGIQNMKGEYFSWLSHDDMYKPQKIEHQIQLLEKYKFDKRILALCGCETMDSSSRIIGKSKQRFDEGLVSWETALYDILKNGSYNGCAFLISKEVLLNAGLFDEDLRYLQDTQMWKMIFAKKNSIVYSNDLDVINRVHGKQLTQTGSALFAAELNKEAEKIIPIIAPISKKEHNFLLAYAQRCAHYGNKEIVEKCREIACGETKFTALDNCRLSIITFYGNIRPVIRKIYYRLFRRIEVK